MLAYVQGYPEIVQILMDRGANVNSLSKYRASPLYIAALNGNLGIVNCFCTRT